MDFLIQCVPIMNQKSPLNLCTPLITYSPLTHNHIFTYTEITHPQILIFNKLINNSIR